MSRDGRVLLLLPETTQGATPHDTTFDRAWHAPVLGELLAEIIVHGEARSLDVGALRPGRFADGQPNPAPVLL